MLSVVIIAWNEESNLPRVVKSVASIADETVVVVDEASTDRTKEVAKDLGCTVFTHPHTGIVEPMRNWAIAKAKGDWILLLDADEEVSPSLAMEIKRVLTLSKFNYFRIPRKNVIFGKWIQSAHWWPDYVYRLFKKGSITWENSIHSIPQTRGLGYDFPAEVKFALIHHTYSSISQYVDRLNRYTDHQCQQMLSGNYKFIWQDFINRPFQEFLNQYFARKGYADGLHGLALSLLQAFSELVLYAKLWQSAGFKSQNISHLDINKQLPQMGDEYHWWSYETHIQKSPALTKPIWRLIRKLKTHLH